MQTRVMNRLFAMAFALLIALSVAAACKDGDSSSQETPSPEATQTPTATPTGHQLPEDFPEDFPLHRSFNISQTARFSDQVLVTAESDAPRSEVADFYRDVLEEPPWELIIEQDLPDENLTLFRFAHQDEPIQGSISILTVNGESTVATLRFTVPEVVGSPVPLSPFITPTPD